MQTSMPFCTWKDIAVLAVRSVFIFCLFAFFECRNGEMTSLHRLHECTRAQMLTESTRSSLCLLFVHPMAQDTHAIVQRGEEGPGLARLENEHTTMHKHLQKLCQPITLLDRFIILQF